jgi:hypothetical protein
VIEPEHPTSSASTVAGISGYSARNTRTRSSNGVNEASPTPRPRGRARLVALGPARAIGCGRDDHASLQLTGA